MNILASLGFILIINFSLGYGQALQKNRNSKFMLSHPVTGNFFRAQQYCLLYNMKLVSILNIPQYNEVQSFLNNLPEPIPGILKIWTSAHDLGAPNEFVWLANGNPVKNIESLWANEQVTRENSIDDYRDCPLDNCGALSNNFNSTVFNLYRNDCFEKNIFLCEY